MQVRVDQRVFVRVISSPAARKEVKTVLVGGVGSHVRLRGQEGVLHSVQGVADLEADVQRPWIPRLG